MDFSLLYIGIGIAIGFSVAAPIGPIGIFCIRQASTYGLIGGVVTGVGASFADAVYTAVAGYGVQFIEGWVQQYMSWFEFLGGAFLIYVAYKIAMEKIAVDHVEDPTRENLAKACWATMIMTFLSPMTTVLFLAMFSKFGVLNDKLTSFRIIELSLGVFIGALLWWVFLSFIVAKVASTAKKFHIKRLLKGPLKALTHLVSLLFPELKTQEHLDLILIVNRVSALCIFVFGVLLLLKGVSVLFL